MTIVNNNNQEEQEPLCYNCKYLLIFDEGDYGYEFNCSFDEHPPYTHFPLLDEDDAGADCDAFCEGEPKYW